MAKVNPSRANLYRQWFAEFQDPANTEFSKDDLVEIPDIGAGTVPKGCKLKQAAAQRSLPLPGDKRYLIDEKIWRLLDADNRAALVLHELVYREAVIDGHEDSARARYLNSVILSSWLRTSMPRDMHHGTSTLELKTFDAQGGSIRTRRI